jgi:hypothetical protein
MRTAQVDLSAVRRDAVGLEEVIGQFGVDPVGPVEPVPGRPLDHPAADFNGQSGRDRRGPPLGLAGLQAVEALSQVGVEPPLDGAGGTPRSAAMS